MTTGMKLAAMLDAMPRAEAGKQRRNALAGAAGFTEALKVDRNARDVRSADAKRDLPSARWAKLATVLETLAPGVDAAKLDIDAAASHLDGTLIDDEGEAKAEDSDSDKDLADGSDQKTRNGIDAIFTAILLKEPTNTPAPVARLAPADEAADDPSGNADAEMEAEADAVGRPVSARSPERPVELKGDGPSVAAGSATTTLARNAGDAGSAAAAAPIGAADTEGPTPAPSSPSPVAATDGMSSPADDIKPEPGRGAKVTILGEQSIPAPALAPTTTAAAFVDTLAGDAGWRAAVRDVAPMQHASAHSSPAPVYTLKLQLHPAELGVVTANLRFAGEQLSIEIQVENTEAYHRLSSDSDTIIKSLRAMGYEIDQVTVQQPQQAVNSNARAESNTGAQSGMQRDGQSFASGNSGGNGDRLGGQGAGRERGNGGQHRDSGGQPRQDRGERGLYI